jgi:hypothetical protein
LGSACPPERPSRYYRPYREKPPIPEVTHSHLFKLPSVPDYLLAALDRRDVALWIHSVPESVTEPTELVPLIALPWRLVLSEVSDARLRAALDATADPGDPLARKRGFIHTIASSPSQTELPPRCLPVYLLSPGETEFRAQLRRLEMLDRLLQSQVQHLVILSGGSEFVPPELQQLWDAGFRTSLTFCTGSATATDALSTWARTLSGAKTVTLLTCPAVELLTHLPSRFSEIYPEDRLFVRMRARSGRVLPVDLTHSDDPEYSILSHYEVIKERDLIPLAPNELSETELVSFFQNAAGSWAPYAAGLPWTRDSAAQRRLRSLLAKLDEVGSDENAIAYVTSEPGAGGTTFVRSLARSVALLGYPVVVAKDFPFEPDAQSLGSFLNRIRIAYREAFSVRPDSVSDSHFAAPIPSDSPSSSLYEVPSVLVFDRIHWESRGHELSRFRRQLAKQGRPVCVLVVAGPQLELAYLDNLVFHPLAELNHALTKDDALRLGRHLNQYLRVYGKERSAVEWEKFHQEHTINYLDGLAAFWVTLSFWIQGQYDLSESIQEWMYRHLLSGVKDATLQLAVLEVAALSVSRLPMPDALMHSGQNEWPVADRLDDIRPLLGPLGLARVAIQGEKFWALIHDVLGRLLLTALFYDHGRRTELGFEHAKNPEHLRFLFLERVSARERLGDLHYRQLGDAFAVSMFKIDPDHGMASFALFWRDVLTALDAMPSSLQNSSRVFRHHTAISRRRVAKLDSGIYSLSGDDRVQLLERAVADIEYALEAIPYTSASEPDINLYNSLAHAYHDLAEVEASRESSASRIIELRRRASEATQKAYKESPTNSFVIETYVRDLLARADSSPTLAPACCVEALGILFSALAADEQGYRRAQLGSLGDRALGLLMQRTPQGAADVPPTNPIDGLTKAWVALAEGVDFKDPTALAEIPRVNRVKALTILGHEAVKGHTLVLRLSYDLICSVNHHDYEAQMEHLEPLVLGAPRSNAQLRLEYAILLYQRGRPLEGHQLFRELRRLWREHDYFVDVPSRLHWLRDPTTKDLSTVHAVVVPSDASRSMAQVSEFQGLRVPFRATEFERSSHRSGTRLTARISFGHNGPFLRPVTARVGGDT